MMPFRKYRFRTLLRRDPYSFTDLSATSTCLSKRVDTNQYSMYPWIMKQMAAIKMLAAIAHDGRLTLFKRLVEVGATGELSGDLGRFAKIRPTTASAQLLVLANAGLILSQREGREIRYFAKYDNVTKLLNFLVSNCCGSEFEMCCPGCGVATQECL